MTDSSVAGVMSGRTATCPVCDGAARIVSTAQPGYQQPSLFSIVQCDVCGTAHASPLETSAAVYDLIYSQAGTLPGYDRYATYAANVGKARDPLAYLGSQEDVYWAVWKALEARDPKSTGPVLEIGSGLGYLTYAMRRRGFLARGLDLSQEAVARANARYGPFYQAADVVDLAKREAGKYELVVMTEVIEHLPDYATVMRAIRTLLRTGGEAIVTTPNRSAYAPGLVWDTDPPPVHLWWFTEAGIREVARRLDMQVRFVDFTPLNERIAPWLPGHGASGVTRGAMFDAAGKLLVMSGPIRRFVPVGNIFMAYANLTSRAIALLRRMRKTPDPHRGRRGTLAFILTKTA